MSVTSAELLAIRVEMQGAKKAAEESLALAKAQKGIGTSATTAGNAAVGAEKKTSRLSKTFGALGKMARWGLGGLAIGGAALALWGKKAVGTTVELAKATSGLQKTFGLSTGTASTFLSLAKVRGADFEKTGMFIKSFATNLRSAATGSASAIGMFRKLGFSQTDIQKGLKNSDYALFKAAAGFGKLEGGLAKGAIASKLFGKGYAKVFPLIREGAKALKEHIAEAKEFGAVLHGSAITSSLQFAEAQRKVELAMLGLQITFTEKVLPSLIKVTNWFAKAMNEFRKGKGPIHSVVEAVKPFAEALFKIGKGIVADETLLKALVLGLIAFKVASLAASVAMDLFDVALWANPIGLVVLGLVALGIALFVAYHKIKWFRDAVDAVFTFVKEHWRILIIPFLPIVGSIVVIVANLGHLKDAFNWVKEAAQNVLNWFQNSTLGKVLSAPFRATLFVVNKLIEGFETAKSLIESIEGSTGPELRADPGRLRQEERNHPAPPPVGSGISHGKNDPLGISPIKPRANKIRHGGGAGGRRLIRIEVPVNLDGKTVAEIVTHHADNAAALA